MIYGYARVSTNSQARDGNSLDVQIHDLSAAGAEEIFSDTFTGSKNSRPQLNQLLKIIQTGDTIIVTRPREVYIEDLTAKGVIIYVLNMGIIDSSPTGKLIRNIMLGI